MCTSSNNRNVVGLKSIIYFWGNIIWACVWVRGGVDTLRETKMVNTTTLELWLGEEEGRKKANTTLFIWSYYKRKYCAWEVIFLNKNLIHISPSINKYSEPKPKILCNQNTSSAFFEPPSSSSFVCSIKFHAKYYSLTQKKDWMIVYIRSGGKKYSLFLR